MTDLQNEMPRGYIPSEEPDPDQAKQDAVEQKNAVAEVTIRPIIRLPQPTDGEVILPDGTIQYYENSKLIKQVSADGRTTLSFTYSKDGALDTITQKDEEGVSVFDFKTNKATRTLNDGDKKVYDFKVRKQSDRYITGLMLPGETLLVWKEGSYSVEIKGVLAEHTLSDGAVLTYNAQGQLTRFVDSDERKSTYDFSYDAEGKISKITLTFGVPSRAVGAVEKIEFDFMTMTAAKTLSGGMGVSLSKFKMKTRNTLMGVMDTIETGQTLGAWRVPIEGFVRGGGFLIYSLIEEPLDPVTDEIPSQIAIYVKELQAGLGPNFTVTAEKSDEFGGYVIRVKANRLGAALQKGQFQEMVLVLKYRPNIIEGKLITGALIPYLAVASVTYAGFDKIDASMLEMGVELLVSEWSTRISDGYIQHLSAMTRIIVLSASDGEIKVKFNDASYRIYKDETGRVQVEKVTEIPSSIESYVKELQEKLGSAFTVSFKQDPADPRRFIITIESALIRTAVVRPGVFSRAELVLFQGNDDRDPQLESLDVRYEAIEKLDGMLLYGALMMINGQDRLGALRSMTGIVVLESGNISIHFKVPSSIGGIFDPEQHYRVSKKQDGTIVVVGELYDEKSRLIQSASLDGKDITYFAYGEDWKVTVEFKNGEFVSAVKIYEDGTTEFYDGLRTIQRGDAQPVDDPDGVKPDETVLWSHIFAGGFATVTVVGTLKEIRYPDGISVTRDMLKQLAEILKTDWNKIMVLAAVLDHNLPAHTQDPMPLYLKVSTPDGTMHFVSFVLAGTVGRVYQVGAVIKTELSIRSVLAIAKAAGIYLRDIDSLYAESMPAPDGIGNAVRLGVQVAVKDGREFVEILDGATVGLDERRDIVYTVSGVIETKLGIRSVVNLAEAMKIDATQLSRVIYEFLSPSENVADLVRIKAMITLKSGQLFEGVLEGSARGIDGNGKIIFNVVIVGPPAGPVPMDITAFIEKMKQELPNHIFTVKEDPDRRGAFLISVMLDPEIKWFAQPTGVLASAVFSVQDGSVVLVKAGYYGVNSVDPQLLLDAVRQIPRPDSLAFRYQDIQLMAMLIVKSVSNGVIRFDLGDKRFQARRGEDGRVILERLAPEDLENYVKSLQAILGDTYLVMISKDAEHGFVIRVIPSAALLNSFPGRPTPLGEFGEMKLILDDSGKPVITFLAYTGFGSDVPHGDPDPALLHAAAKFLAGGENDKALLFVTRFRLTASTSGRVEFVHDGTGYYAMRDAAGNVVVAVLTEEPAEIPEVVQSYVKNLQAKLGEGFRLSTAPSREAPGKFLITVEPVFGLYEWYWDQKLVYRPEIIPLSSFENAVLEVDGADPSKSRFVSVRYLETGELDAELLAGGLSQLPHLQYGDRDDEIAFVLGAMSNLIIDRTADNEIQFIYSGASYRVFRDKDGNIILERLGLIYPWPVDELF